MENDYIKTDNILFEEFGSYEGINKASIHLLKKILSDESINDLFLDTNINTLIDEFGALLAYILDAPFIERKNPLEVGNHHFVKRHLNESHFITLLTHLISALRELNHSNQIINEIAVKMANSKEAIIEEYRKVILVGLLKTEVN